MAFLGVGSFRSDIYVIGAGVYGVQVGDWVKSRSGSGSGVLNKGSEHGL